MIEERPDRRRNDPERALKSDRRDSPRLLLKFRVLDENGRDFVMHEGDVSIGGAYFTAEAPPISDPIELEIPLPEKDGAEVPDVIRCSAKLIRATRQEDGLWGIHLAFSNMKLEDEQALARFIDGYLKGKAQRENQQA